MDFTSAYLFGLSNGTDFMHNANYRRHWLAEYKTFKTQLPRERAGCEIERWCLSMCEAAEPFIRSGEEVKQDPSSTQPVVYGRLTQSLRESAQSDNPEENPAIIVTAASEMLDHLIAGHETSGITLTYLMYELSQRPSLQDRLRAELLSFDPSIPRSSQTLATPTLPTRKSTAFSPPRAISITSPSSMPSFRKHSASTPLLLLNNRVSPLPHPLVSLSTAMRISQRESVLALMRTVSIVTGPCFRSRECGTRIGGMVMSGRGRS